MRNILFKFLVLILFYHTSIYASNQLENDLPIPVKCAPQLQASLNAIQKIPEARALITSIQKEGAIQIVVKNTTLSNQFGAFWDPDRRIICIGLSPNSTQASIIGSILFELHNAAATSKIDHLDALASRGQIDKERYVESMEYLEYLNSLKSAKIAEKGIKMGVLPPGSQLPTYNSFKEHFLMQKRSGHSACFARNYDHLSPRSFRRQG